MPAPPVAEPPTARAAVPFPGLSPYPAPAAARRPPHSAAAGWPAAGGWPPPHPTGLPPRPMSVPSGLFPSGPPRPVFREPFPVRGGAVALGVVGGGLWMMLFGLLASDASGYAWITIIAGLVAWVVAQLLARFGDRGAAAGVAMSAAVGLSIVTVVIGVRWAAGDWLLW